VWLEKEQENTMTNPLSRLHRFIVEHYSLEDLRTLCFNLGVSYDELGKEKLSTKARELLLWMGRWQKLDQLLDALRESRPEAFDGAGFSTDPAVVEALYASSDCQQAYGELRAQLEGIRPAERQCGAPIVSPIETRPANYFMRAVDKGNPQRFFQVTASPWDTISFIFDITNPNELDMRVVSFYVDVEEFVDVDIIRLTTGALGGGVVIRKSVCEVKPQAGRYECIQVSKDYDYIKLSSGEMETFRIDVAAPKQGIYLFKLAIEYSIAGEVGIVELDHDIQEIGFFDRSRHMVYDVSAEQWVTV
jgi:hypothetical protein